MRVFFMFFLDCIIMYLSNSISFFFLVEFDNYIILYPYLYKMLKDSIYIKG